MKPAEIFIRDYEYDLPNDNIAMFPLEKRDDSRLLCFRNNEITITRFKELPSLLPSNSALILNNTRVIDARIFFQKKTGGIIEIFCLRPESGFDINQALSATQTSRWLCFVGGVSKWKQGEILFKEIDGRLTLAARFIAKKEDAFIIEFTWDPSGFSFAEILHAAGTIPLPPYIKRKTESTDLERYQTIFAAEEGSVAAPTAALHFTTNVFDDLYVNHISTHYITLHVGAGTFKPVKTDTIAGHQMHTERFEVSLTTLEKLKSEKDLIAVGTTSIRTMESLYWIGIKILKGIIKGAEQLSLGQWEAYEIKDDGISYQQSITAIIDYLQNKNTDSIFCETSLLIIPGYSFRSAKALITNFHQPRSTLLLLVAAFVGSNWKSIYEFALEKQFRFLSYGDSSLLWRNESASKL